MAGNFSIYSPLEYSNQFFDTLHKVELSFNERRAIPWMRGHWHWSFIYSALYLLLIVLGQRIMRDRKSYNLRTALCCWSAGLSLFSFYAVYRITPIAYNMVYLGGLQHAICDTSSYTGSQGGGIWAFLFPLSKLPELVDTSFIILRKQKLVILHWYHHVTVFIYCWFSYAFPISTGIWFGIVNYTVHAIMYAYYAVKASGRSPPRWVAKSITTVQLSQMFVGILLNYLAIKSLVEGKTCEMNPFAIGISIFFYASYAVLFGNFYYWTYIYKKPGSRGQGSQKATDPTTTTMTATTTPVNGFAAHLNGSGSKLSEISNGKVPHLNGMRSRIPNEVEH